MSVFAGQSRDRVLNNAFSSGHCEVVMHAK